MNTANRPTSALWAVCLTACLLISIASSPAFGHGEKGRRIVLLYDLSSPQTEPTEIMTVSNAYQMQLLACGASGDNDCLHLQTGPVRFSWDKAPAQPPPVGQLSATADYIVWGEYTSGSAAGLKMAMAAPMNTVR